MLCEHCKKRSWDCKLNCAQVLLCWRCLECLRVCLCRNPVCDITDFSEPDGELLPQIWTMSNKDSGESTKEDGKDSYKSTAIKSKKDGNSSGKSTTKESKDPGKSTKKDGEDSDKSTAIKGKKDGKLKSFGKSTDFKKGKNDGKGSGKSTTTEGKDLGKRTKKDGNGSGKSTKFKGEKGKNDSLEAWLRPEKKGKLPNAAHQ